MLLPLPLSGAYDYAVEADGPLTRGRLVRAPLGSRSLLGVVWGHAEGAVASEKLRVAGALERHRLPERLCDFVDWVARYTLSPPGAVLAQALRVKDAFDAETPRKALIKADREPQLRLTDARSRVLALMADGLARTPSEIAELASVSPGVVTGLAQAGALNWVDLPEFERVSEPDPDFNPASLTPDQLRAGEHFRDAVKKREFAVALLDGVTGSGKTEAYFEGIAEALARGRAGSDPAARNRAHRAVPRSLRRALRLPSARMALGSFRARTPSRLSRGVLRRSARCRRRALCAVPPLYQARLHRRR